MAPVPATTAIEKKQQDNTLDNNQNYEVLFNADHRQLKKQKYLEKDKNVQQSINSNTITSPINSDTITSPISSDTTTSPINSNTITSPISSDTTTPQSINSDTTTQQSINSNPQAQPIIRNDDFKRNDYMGFQVTTGSFMKPYPIERIAIEDLTPEKFYCNYIAARKPVVIQGLLNGFEASEKWTNEYLIEKAGKVQVKVERRENNSARFGKGNHVTMSFEDMIHLVEKGDDLHYMTTQDLPINDMGQHDIMAPPVTQLKNDVPLRPKLMGNLIPHNLNLWFGNNKIGSSSGLHHDYHDNLYILLRGKKSFRLYSPNDAEYMYTKGTLSRIHHNGRINYLGEETCSDGAQEETFSDGDADDQDEKQETDKEAELAAKTALACAEREVEEAEEALERGEEGAEERLDLAEQNLDKAMENLLEVGVQGEPDEENMYEKLLYDDRDDEDHHPEDIKDEPEDCSKKKVSSSKVVVQDPFNFSTVDLSLSKEELEKLYPLFMQAKPAVCQVGVGEMLYLPASWFHEVTSIGSENGHMAFNYWFHPPDAGVDHFEKPYVHDVWPKDWESREVS